MGAGLRQDFVETVRQSGDIVQLISDYVPLKKAGTRYKGLCPFHQEKSPSFSVDSDRQLFYCFGCQTGGDIFRFVQLYEKLEFPEALEFLARRWGVPIPQRDARSERQATERERLLTLLADAQAWFRKQLVDPDAGAAARAYVERRGLSAATVEGLQIGCVPDGWRGLVTHLTTRRFTPPEIVRAGLAMERKEGGGCYDRFRNRLTFPIRDVQGRVIAFGGRTLGEDSAKYINSPETPAYVKGEHLYGLDLARDAIRREGLVIVVEGYLDLAAVREAGCDNVVASLGTAFTANQARLLSRYTQRVVFSYDGDAAGAGATARSLDLLLQRGFEVRVVDLPGGQDPDDFIRREGAAAYDALVRRAPDYLEFLIRRELRDGVPRSGADKVAAVNAVLPHVARLESAIERATWIKRIADAFDIEEALIAQELRAAARDRRTSVRGPVDAPGVRSQRPHDAELLLVALLLGSEAARDRLFDRWDPALFEGSAIERILGAIVPRIEADLPVDYPSVLAALEQESDRELFTRIAFSDVPLEHVTLDDCLSPFQSQGMSRRERQMIRGISGRETVRDAMGEQVEAEPADDLDERLRQVLELKRQREALMEPGGLG